MSFVKLSNVSVAFPRFQTKANSTFFSKMIGRGVVRKDFYALNDISLSFNEGDRVALLGDNGSGKSTLLKVLSGALPPSSGGVEIEGEVFPALTSAPNILYKATCEQNIILQGLSFGLSGAMLANYVECVGEFSELGDFLNSPYSSLSAGMKSRFAVSTLHTLKPELLFMDEWVGAADKKVLEKNNGLLSSMIKDCEIFVLASHRKELVRDFCNKAVVLKSGKVVFEGDVDTALKHT